MGLKRYSNVIGFDDAPFPRNHQGEVKVVGTIFAQLRFEGVLVGKIHKDGSDAADELARLVARSKFADHAQLIMLQGIALGGFNVVDVFALYRTLGLPLLVVARKRPDMAAIGRILTTVIPGGRKKWAIIEKLGPMIPVGKVFIQKLGLSIPEAAAVIERFTIHGHIPEPIRTAHLIAGAIGDGQSRGRP